MSFMLEGPRPCKSFVLRSFTMHALRAPKRFYWLVPQYGVNNLFGFVHSHGQKANKIIQQGALLCFITIPLYYLWSILLHVEAQAYGTMLPPKNDTMPESGSAVQTHSNGSKNRDVHNCHIQLLSFQKQFAYLITSIDSVVKSETHKKHKSNK